MNALQPACNAMRSIADRPKLCDYSRIWTFQTGSWKWYSVCMIGKTTRVVLVLLLLVLASLTVFPASAQAARTRARKVRDTGSQVALVSQGVGVSVRFRPDRLGIQLNFSNFDAIESGSYSLIYDANGVTQQAGGSIMIGDTDTKELLFATCSHAVCTFHENITNARLSITSRLKNGQSVLKPFRLRV